MARRKSVNPATPSSISTRSSARISASKSGTSTPATSLLDETRSQTKEVNSVARANGKRTREASVDSDNLDATDEKITTKKRVLSRSAYVELTRKSVSIAETPSKAKDEHLANGRASSPLSEVEFLSDEELVYEESDSSGSEFRPSNRTKSHPRHFQEDELDLLNPAFQDMDEDEAEAAMMSAAIQASLASSSKNASNSRSAASSSRRPTAAGKRQRPKTFPTSDEELFEPSDSDWMSDEDEDEDSEEEPLSRNGKLRGKGKKASSFYDDDVEVWQNRREQARLRRKEARENANIRRKEEMALRRKLGRKLTHAERTSLALYRHHPELRDVWGDLEEKIPITMPVKDTQPAGLKLTLLPFQLESLYWMKKQEKGVWTGGMLADEMGMGKTIQTIALFVSDRQKPNLIIAPTVAVMQWKNEIEAHTEGFKVLLWHGSNREQNVKELQKYDVVLTSYAVLESCFRKQQSGFKRNGQIVKERSSIHTIEWKRIILDEAHNIKERSTNTAKAAFELSSKFKWCLSGTPLQNRVGELYSLIRFLGGDPFSYYFCKNCSCKSLHWRFSDKRTCDDCGHSPTQHTCFWNNEILTPIQKHAMEGPGRLAFKKLKILLDRMMLRRTKIERADDLGLPPRTVIVRRDYFSEEENELYLSLFSDAKRQFSTYVDSGTLLNNYSNIFSLITRMRQMACHPDLVLKSKQNYGKLSEDLAEAAVCRLCHDIAEDAVRSKCHHIFDRECMRQYLSTAVEKTPACPVCHLPISVDLDAPAVEFDDETKTKASRQGMLGRLDLDTWRSSTKIEALVEELTNLRRQDATTKSLVFSQFVNFLDLIAFRLQRAGFNICRLEGTMSPQARDATIKHFMNNVHVNVFLVSLKAGGVALNLTEASRVYLMDSWWNPAVEYQAMDRIHRLGQYRPVQAIKLVIENSIESRIIQLQEKKKAMVDATLSTDDSAMGRLTPEDLQFLFRL